MMQDTYERDTLTLKLTATLILTSLFLMTAGIYFNRHAEGLDDVTLPQRRKTPEIVAQMDDVLSPPVEEVFDYEP